MGLVQAYVAGFSRIEILVLCRGLCYNAFCGCLMAAEAVWFPFWQESALAFSFYGRKLCQFPV
ncbi:hypothetical protein D7V86_01855 [bacterium D16-51]|nr:hypothetical protein D7V96_01280 [bacterium D16-59]RKI62288.1 hypothetical protein D7V86_01855 [bacterium D16-51]